MPADLNLIADAAYQAGFRGDELVTAVAVSLAESGGDPSINNAGMNSNGSVDYGLWQINSIHGPNLDQVYDPYYNAKLARKIYQDAKGWTPWVAWKKGMHQRFLTQARQAVAAYDPAQTGYAPEYGPAPTTMGVLTPTGPPAKQRAQQGLAALARLTRMRAERSSSSDGDDGDSTDRDNGRANLPELGFNASLRQRASDREQAERDRAMQAAMSAGGTVDVPADEDAVTGDMFGTRDGGTPWEAGRRAYGGKYDNGKVDMSELESIGSGEYAHREAARAWRAMADAAREAGITIGVTDGYRSYDEQVAVKRKKGKKAATPGRSIHGWGLALDLSGVGGFNTAAYRWLSQNAAQFGFTNPAWARQGGSNPEHWHWEYIGGYAGGQ